MDNANVAKSYKFGDQSTSDVIVRLRNQEGRPELFYCHSFILKTKSKFFAEKLLDPYTLSSIEIHCSDFDYDHHVDLLRFHRPYNVKRSHLAASSIWRLCLGRIRKRKRY